MIASSTITKIKLVSLLCSKFGVMCLFIFWELIYCLVIGSNSIRNESLVVTHGVLFCTKQCFVDTTFPLLRNLWMTCRLMFQSLVFVTASTWSFTCDRYVLTSHCLDLCLHGPCLQFVGCNICLGVVTDVVIIQAVWCRLGLIKVRWGFGEVHWISKEPLCNSTRRANPSLQHLIILK